MVKSCIFANCLNNSKSQPQLLFHPFVKPSLEPERAKKWLEIANRGDLSLKNINKHSYVCHKHFLPDLYDYNWQTNKILEPIPNDLIDYDVLKEKQKNYLKHLVEVLDPDTILECVGKKLFEAFSMDDLEAELNNLGLSGKSDLEKGN